MRARAAKRRADGLRTPPRHGLAFGRAALGGGLLALAAAWALAVGVHGMTPHMTAHMLTVVLAAPLLALAARGTALDAASRWPAVVAPVQMSVVELVAVWGWHAPAARAFAASGGGAVLEQLTFVAAGWLLWIACFGGGARGADGEAPRRGAAVIALLLTTMHMTLLGVLIALAPRLLYATHGFSALGLELAPLQDQQLGGVVMLTVGAGAYLGTGLWCAARLLHARAPQAAEAP